MTTEELLRELIIKRYGTVVAFGKRVGLPSSTLYSILTRGVNNASAQNVLKICEALEISADALAEGLIKPKDSFVPSIDIEDWLCAEKSHLLNVNLTIDGKPLTESQRLVLWDSLRMSADFIRRNT